MPPTSTPTVGPYARSVPSWAFIGARSAKSSRGLGQARRMAANFAILISDASVDPGKPTGRAYALGWLLEFHPGSSLRIFLRAAYRLRDAAAPNA
jgi:hypothetical protein